MRNIEVYRITEPTENILTVEYAILDSNTGVSQQISRAAIEQHVIDSRLNITEVFQGGTWINEIVYDVKEFVNEYLPIIINSFLAFHLS